MLQFSCGRTPFTFCNASKILEVGFFFKKAVVYTSTGTGVSILETGFSVPEITTSSNVFESSCKVKLIVISELFSSVIFFFSDLNPMYEAVIV